MSFPIASDDLRSVKTEKALYAAMRTLLQNSSFRKITIKRICEEALISRATFYAHYIDKYDLLKQWMAEVWPASFTGDVSYEQLEELTLRKLDDLVIVKNVLYEADQETYGILFDFLLTTIDLSVDKTERKETVQKNVVLANFYAGGLISYILWQIKFKFPPEVPLMNRSLYKMIGDLRDWHAKQA